MANMIKKYTRTEWANLMKKLPVEDRTPYEESPEIPDPKSNSEKAKIIDKIEQGVPLTPQETAAISPVTTQQTFTQPVAPPDSNLSVAPTPITASEKATIIDKIEQGIPLTANEVQVIAPTTTGAGVATPAANIQPITGETVETPVPLPTPTPTPVSPVTPIVTPSIPVEPPVTPTPPTPPGPTQTYTAPDGKIFTDLDAYNKYLEQLKIDEKKAIGQSAYDLLFQQFNQYGLGALVEPLKGFITEGLSPAEFTLRLRDTDAYKKRFAANAQRIAKGLTALSEAEYIGLEDQYQNVMRNYGLPEYYYTRGDMGRQEGFEKFIAGDVSAPELEDRIILANERVIKGAPQIAQALKEFYPDITNGDILAYALDPQNALKNIQRKVSAAEIGGAAVQMGLATNVTDAEYLARYGITKEQAQAGYRNVAEVLPRSSMLGDIYAKQGMGPYTQQTAEKEVFNVPGAAEAAAKRRKLAELEQASFSGQAGVGALARERAGQF